MFVSLDKDVMQGPNSLAYVEASYHYSLQSCAVGISCTFYPLLGMLACCIILQTAWALINNDMILLVRQQALSAGLKALKVLGITGISLDIYWGLVESGEPGVYNWSGYRTLLRFISDFGFKIKVGMEEAAASDIVYLLF